MQFKIREWQGITLDDDRVNEMMQDVARFLKTHPEETISYTMTGNTLVLGLQDERCTYIEVYHAKIERYATQVEPDDFFTV
jgi:hypothetical protein